MKCGPVCCIGSTSVPSGSCPVAVSVILLFWQGHLISRLLHTLRFVHLYSDTRRNDSPSARMNSTSGGMNSPITFLPCGSPPLLCSSSPTRNHRRVCLLFTGFGLTFANPSADVFGHQVHQLFNTTNFTTSCTVSQPRIYS